jgi:ectoine hydroxylase-related dioxygenase (phytanoyl-CoA dioxygenase family)
MLLSQETIQRYHEEGYAFLPGIIEPSALDLIRRGIDRNLAKPSPWAVTAASPGTRYLEDKCNFGVNAEFQQALYESSIVDVLAQLIGTDRVWLYYEQVICKLGAAKATAWHQDMSYYLMAPGAQSIGAWISLDPLEAEQSLEVIAKSHKGPLYNMQDPKRYNTQDSKVAGGTGFAFDFGGDPMPDIEGNRAAYDIVSFKTQPGDMLVFHRQMLHGGAPMIAGQQRRALSISVFGPEMRYQPKPDWYAPTFPGLEKILKPGDPLHWAAETGYFPQLRPLPAKRWSVATEHDMWHGRMRDTPAKTASEQIVSEHQ